jgi:similar to stage IV sporulation protein
VARKRVKEYLQGYVRVEVKGKNPERLVNLCLTAGFPVWDFAPADGAILFSTTLGRYRDIHRLARRARCVPHVVKRVGLPFTVGKLRRRPWFLLAAAVVVALLLYLSGSVWSVRVTGYQKTDPDTVLHAAASAGLAPGARRGAVSASQVESAVAREIPELSWVYVKFQGIVAVIEVVEKSRPDITGPGDVVATRDGVVESVLVLSGVPVVKPGQTVKQGDLLIAGNPSGTLRGARGSVVARTWYEMYREVPLVQPSASRTGRKIEMTVVRYRGVELVLWGKSNAFEWYEVEDYPRWRALTGTEHALTVFTRVLFEVKWTSTSISPEDAFATTERQMRSSIERQLPSYAKLVDLSCRIEATARDMVAVRAIASAIEDIGEVRPWSQQETEVGR